MKNSWWTAVASMVIHTVIDKLQMPLEEDIFWKKSFCFNGITIPTPIMDEASIQKLLFWPWVAACFQERLWFTTKMNVNSFHDRKHMCTMFPYTKFVCEWVLWFPLYNVFNVSTLRFQINVRRTFIIFQHISHSYDLFSDSTFISFWN